MKNKSLKTGDWPHDGIESVTSCPVCGSEEYNLLYRNLIDNVFFTAPGKWSLYKCSSCDSGFLNPRPTQKSINLAYSSYFTHDSPEIPEHKLSINKKIRKYLANNYRSWKYGNKSKNTSMLALLIVLLTWKRRRLLDASMRHLKKPVQDQYLLDFGCGNGLFLNYAQSCGWNTVGIDFDPQAVNIARKNGLNVKCGGTEKIPEFNIQFDVITLSHVIEHVHDPHHLLSTCYNYLKPGGILWIETPNFNSQGHFIYGSNWRGLEPPRHLMLFTRKSLLSLLEKTGFHEIEDMPENPVVPSIFGASEAIKHNEDPITNSDKWIRANRRSWKKYEKISEKDASQREFITLTCLK